MAVTGEDLCKEWKELVAKGKDRQAAIEMLSKKYYLPTHEIARRILEVI